MTRDVVSIDHSKQRFIKYKGPWEESSQAAYPANWDHAEGFLASITPPLHADTSCHQRYVSKFAAHHDWHHDNDKRYFERGLDVLLHLLPHYQGLINHLFSHICPA